MSNENQLFWKAYASAVKKMIASSPVGKNTKVYIAPANTAGITGGDDIPPEITNWGIYQHADFLLDPTNPNWVASKVTRYSEALAQTLANVKPVKGRDTTPDAQDRLTKAQQKASIYYNEMREAKKNAMKDFNDDDNPDKAKFFAQWAPLNAKGFIVAVKNWETANSEVDRLNIAIIGSESNQLSEAREQVAKGMNALVEVNGYNMRASSKSVTYDASGKVKIPEIVGQFVPLYSIPGYATLLDGWVANSEKEPDRFVINLATGNNSSYNEIGFTDDEGAAAFGRLPVFEFYAKQGRRVDDSTFNMTSDAKNVKVTLKVQHHKIVQFQPGAWIVDVNGLIAKTGAKAPPMTQKVRPTQMLIAQGISMKVSFTGNAKTAFDNDYKKTVQDGGGINIFGFRIGSPSSSEENTTHKNNWDSNSGTLTINSENSRASANVLAVMGEIVSA